MKAAWLRNSLKNKLVLAFVLIYAVPMIVTLVLVFTFTAADTRRNALDELQNMNDEKALQIEQFIETKRNHVREYSASEEMAVLIRGLDELKTDQTGAVREDAYQDLVSDYGIPVKQLFVQAGFTRMAVLERYQGTLLFDHNFRYEDLGRSVRSEDAGDRRLAEIADRVRTSGLETIWDAYHPGSLEDSLVYYAVPLYDQQGNFTHVLIAGHSLNQVNMMVSMDYGQFSTRDSFLVNSSSVILTEPRHPSGDVRLGERTEHSLVREALRSFPERNSREYRDSDLRRLGSYSPVRTDRLEGIQNDVSWVIVSYLDRSEVQQLVFGLFGWVLALILLVGVAVFFIARMLARGIADPIIEVTQGMKHLAAGNLSFSAESGREDEIGDMVRAATDMVVQLKTILDSLRHAVTTASSVGATISSSVEQQSAISVEQAGSVSEISSTMDEFSTSFSQVSESVGSVSGLSEEIYTRINESAGLIDSVAQKMRDINNDNDQDISYIMELKNKSKDISKIMEIINSISDQTKIISFNAALEASSAGESGKRFGVVAAEIRKLTEDVIRSTGLIDTLISEIQTLSDKMVLASEKTTKNIRQGLDSSDDSVGNIERIVESIKKSNESTKQIAMAVRQQQTAASQIQSGLKELSEGARQNSEAIQAINESGSEFQEVTGHLEEIIRHFKHDHS